MGQARLPRDDTNTTAQVGEGLGNPAPRDALGSPVDVAQARKLVEAQCLQCHDQDSVSDEAIAKARAGTAEPMIPPRWFKHGLYDHAAHARIDCRYCHEAAYPTDGAAKPPTDHETVMIGGIETCTGCHRDGASPPPAAITTADVVAMLGGQANWKSDACTLCHRYHTPLQLPKHSAVTLTTTEASP